MLFNIKPNKRSGAITEGSFSFTGSYIFARNDETGHWELALTSDGTLTWLVDPGLVDLFIVGAGKNGGSGSVSGTYQYAEVHSGNGGDGGRILIENGVELSSSVSADVGTGEAESSLGDYTSANAPEPKKGGTGAFVYQKAQRIVNLNEGGKDGVFAWGAQGETIISAFSSIQFGPSGGGGHAQNNGYVDGNGTFYPDPTYTDLHGGVNTGGVTGGGNGGTRDQNGDPATGYGAGGGGGYANGSTQVGKSGGAGSDGVILIRDHREVS